MERFSVTLQTEFSKVVTAMWDEVDRQVSAKTREKDVEVEDFKAKLNVLDKENRALREQLLELSKKQRRDESLSLAVQVPVYRDDTAATREQTELGKEQQLSVLSTGQSRKPLGYLSTNQVANPRRTIKALPEKHEVDWEQEHARIFKRLEASKKSEEKYKNIATRWRERTREWQNHAEILGAKVEELENKASAGHDKVQSQPPVTENRAAEPGGCPLEARIDEDLEAPIRRPAYNLSFSSDPDTNRSFAATASTRHNSEKLVTSAPEPAEEITVGHEPRRSTERDHHPHTHRDHPEDSDQETCDGTENNASLPPLPTVSNEDTPIAIKSEPSSEGVVFLSERCLKRKRAGHDGNVAPRRRVKSESSSDLQTLGQTIRFSPQDNIDLGSDSRQDDVLTPSAITDTPESPEVTSPNRQPFSRIQDNRAAEPLVLFHGPIEAPQSPHAEPSARHRTRRSRHRGEPLNSRFSRLARAVEELGEDGQFGPGWSSQSLETGELSSPIPEPVRTGKLASLLDNPPPPRPMGQAEGYGHDLIASNDQRTGDMSTSSWRRAQAGNPEKPGGTVVRTPIGSIPGNPEARPGQSPSLQTPRPTPMRQRPVSSLTLADFKINPKANEGRSFAYSEVVRGKTARASLDGCTNYNCCGRFFSLMARNEFEAGGPSLLLQPASIKLLEDYLGDDAHRLGSMNRTEKEDLWIEAKMRQQANRYGRHRDKGATRRPTPPGFHDHDMPTTQEMEVHKREAKKQEMALVEERRKEALRPGGRWLFRDEQ